MPLGSRNYLYIALGAAVIAASYGTMYLERDIDGFFSLTIAPFTLTAAYLWIVFAIFRRPKKQGDKSRS
jgi:general stress protein CsbA